MYLVDDRWSPSPSVPLASFHRQLHIDALLPFTLPAGSTFASCSAFGTVRRATGGRRSQLALPVPTSTTHPRMNGPAREEGRLGSQAPLHSPRFPICARRRPQALLPFSSQFYRRLILDRCAVHRPGLSPTRLHANDQPCPPFRSYYSSPRRPGLAACLLWPLSSERRRSMSDRAGSFEAGGEYAELHYPDLELSGPDDFAIFLINREVHKAFTSSSSATSIPPWLLTLHRQRQEDQRPTPDENKCSILARESQAHRCAHSQDTLKVYCSPNKRCKQPSIAT